MRDAGRDHLTTILENRFTRLYTLLAQEQASKRLPVLPSVAGTIQDRASHSGPSAPETSGPAGLPYSKSR